MIRSFATLALFSSLALTACGSTGSDTTTGKRIVLHTRAAGDATTKTKLTTGFGWDVTLTKAAVATTGLYYFDGPPPTAMFRAPKRNVLERFGALFVGTAYAHPGHYQSGTALGEVVLPKATTLDLFGPTPIALPDGQGITGSYRSARFVIAPTPTGDAVLGTHVAVAEGQATKHDGTSAQPIFFRLVADYADVQGSIQNGAVDGCVLDEVTVQDSGTVALEIRPAIWLNLVDFSKIAPGSATTPTEARDAGFSQGVTELSAYHFTYSK